MPLECFRIKKGEESRKREKKAAKTTEGEKKGHREKETNKENDKENSVEERKNAELSLDEAKEENAKLLKELEKFADDNPEFNEQVTKGVKVAQVAADRWTDNLFLVKSWADKKFGDTEATKSLFKKEGIDLNSLDYPGA